MIEYSSIVRYGLDHLNIDQNKSYETYDKTTNYHIIHLYFIKDEILSCSTCNSNDLTNVRTKKSTIKYASALEDNITLILHRRIYKCNKCGCHNLERNPFTISKIQTSIQKEIKILHLLAATIFYLIFINDSTFKFNVLANSSIFLTSSLYKLLIK